MLLDVLSVEVYFGRMARNGWEHLHYLKKLLVLQEPVKIFCLNWLVAICVGAYLVRRSEDVSHTELTKSVAAVRQYSWLSFVERIIVLAAVAAE